MKPPPLPPPDSTIARLLVIVLIGLGIGAASIVHLARATLRFVTQTRFTP